MKPKLAPRSMVEQLPQKKSIFFNFIVFLPVTQYKKTLGCIINVYIVNGL